MRIGQFPKDKVKRNIQYIRENWPRGLAGIPQTAYQEIANEINEACGTNYGELEIWKDRGTGANKYRYVKDALCMLDYVKSDGGWRAPLVLTDKTQLILDLYNSGQVMIQDYGSAASWWVPPAE